jgi:hypothetical protein
MHFILGSTYANDTSYHKGINYIKLLLYYSRGEEA